MECIVLIKSILYLDENLPLIFELKRAGKISSPLFFSRNKKAYEYLRKNVVLCDAIHSMGGKLICLNRYNNRYVNQVYNLFVLRRYLCKRVLSIETYDLDRYHHGWLPKLPVLNQKIFKGKRFRSLVFNRPFQQAKNILYSSRILKNEFETKEKKFSGYDCFLTTHTKEQYEEITMEKLNTKSPVIQVGYTRGMEEWNNFLNKNIDHYLSQGIKTPYFFYVLTYMGKWMAEDTGASADDLFRESLLVFKEFNADILTVFKPHQNTDMDKAQRIIDDVGYENYKISYLHPWVLMNKAKFTFSYSGSAILIDAYFNGNPTVEYTHYDPRILEMTNGQPRYLECVDYFIDRDMKQLRDVAYKHIYKAPVLKRDADKLKQDFPILNHKEVCEKFEWLV